MIHHAMSFPPARCDCSSWNCNSWKLELLGHKSNEFYISDSASIKMSKNALVFVYDINDYTIKNIFTCTHTHTHAHTHTCGSPL